MSDKKKQQQQQQRLEELERRHKASIQKRETLAAMITRIETEEHSLSVMLKEKRDELRRAGDPGATGSTMRNKSDKACGIVSSIKPYMFLVDDIPEISLVVGKEAAATRPNVQKSSIVGPANPNGVEHSTSDAIEDLVAACTVSTYPRMPGTDRRVKKKKEKRHVDHPISIIKPLLTHSLVCIFLYLFPRLAFFYDDYCCWCYIFTFICKK